MDTLLIVVDYVLFLAFFIAVGWSFGAQGLRATFTQPPRRRLPMAVLAMSAVSLFLWLHATYGFQFPPAPIAVLALVLLGSFLLGRSRRSQTLSDFNAAAELAKPFHDAFYKVGRALTPEQQLVINDHRPALERAVELFRAAREGELRGTPLGGGAFANYVLVMLPGEMDKCPVCDTGGYAPGAEATPGPSRRQCTNCQSVILVGPAGSAQSGLRPVRLVSLGVFGSIARMPKKAIVTAKNRREAAVALHEIGIVYRLLTEFDRARSALCEAHAEMRELHDRFGQQSPAITLDLALFCLHLGDVEQLSGETGAARDWFEEAANRFADAGDERGSQNVRLLLASMRA